MSDTETLTRQEHIAVLARLLKVVIGRIKELELELAAHILGLDAFKATLPESVQTLDAALAHARQLPVLQEKLRQEYDIPLQRFLALSAELQTEEELWKLFLKKRDDLIH
jgi:hypothetical protein